MKSACTLLLVLLLFVSLSAVQTMQAQAPARTDVYHVHLAKAALGKGAEEGEQLKKQGPKAPMPGHLIVLRHQSGEDWDYAVIEHLGTKATIDATGNAPSAAARDRVPPVRVASARPQVSRPGRWWTGVGWARSPWP